MWLTRPLLRQAEKQCTRDTLAAQTLFLHDARNLSNMEVDVLVEQR